MRDLFDFRTLSVLMLLIAGGAPAFAQSFSIYDNSPRQRGQANALYTSGLCTPSQKISQNVTAVTICCSIVPSEKAVTPLRSLRISNGRWCPIGHGAGGHHRNRYAQHLPLLRAWRQPGHPLRHGVGRDGFTWSGVRTIERKTEWPDWIPPTEMIDRQPDLPRWMAGGPGNPLGARAMYLAGTLYRIHGTSEPSTIGKRVSSGCIRMLNEDVSELYDRVHVGTRVVVQPESGRRVASGAESERQRRIQGAGAPENDGASIENGFPAMPLLPPLRLD
jgi:hypothetical protein